MSKFTCDICMHAQWCIYQYAAKEMVSAIDFGYPSSTCRMYLCIWLWCITDMQLLRYGFKQYSSTVVAK